MLQFAAPSAEYVPELQVVQNSAAGNENVPARQFLQTMVAPRLHVASNPGKLIISSAVKITCKYPVDDVYTLLDNSLSL